MLPRMPDFSEIDRQLDALGRVPEDVAGLLARNLGENRSPAALDQLLAALGSAPAPEARVPNLEALSDFPPSQPPASESNLPQASDTQEFPRPPSTPVPAAGVASDAASSDDDDFEMLIEDEEILEIQEDDVEEDEPNAES
jgi:hypothetical protein